MIFQTFLVLKKNKSLIELLIYKLIAEEKIVIFVRPGTHSVLFNECLVIALH